jgi:DNA-binding IclR family transcriptional regulator
MAEQTAPTVQSVRKAMALLDCLAFDDMAREGLPLARLAQACGLPTNTAHSILKTLVEAGYAAQLARGVYAAGPRCAQLARAALVGDDAFRARVREALAAFVAVEGEACVCATLVDGARVVLASLDSTRAIRVARSEVEDVPFFAKPTGRMLAAFADDEARRRILERHGMPGATWDGIADKATFLAALDALRGQGWCVVEDRAEGLVSLAVPVLAPDGAPWGAIGAFAPSYRCPPERYTTVRQSLVALASALTAVLAGAPPSGVLP